MTTATKRGRPRTGGRPVQITLTPSQRAIGEWLGDDNLSGGIRAALEHYMNEIKWVDDVYPHVICPDPKKSKMLVAKYVRREIGADVVLDRMATDSGHAEPDYPDTLAPYLERYRRFETRAVSPEIRSREGANGFVRWIERDGQRVNLPEFNIGTAPLYSPVTDKLIGEIGIFSPWMGKPRFLAFSRCVPAADIAAICEIFRDWNPG